MRSPFLKFLPVAGCAFAIVVTASNLSSQVPPAPRPALDNYQPGPDSKPQRDGTLEWKQPFYWVHVPDWADDSGAGEMCMDRDGRAYVATRLGVQVFDRNGRARGILPMPEGQPTSVCFGGAAFDTLFVTSGGRLYRRRMQSFGAPAFLAPITLPPWGAG